MSWVSRKRWIGSQWAKGSFAYSTTIEYARKVDKRCASPPFWIADNWE